MAKINDCQTISDQYREEQLIELAKLADINLSFTN